MNVDESWEEASNFKCYGCTTDFKTKDTFMKHKKSFHPANVLKCEKFVSNKCDRSNEQCWFKQIDKTTLNSGHQDFSAKEQVLWEARRNSLSPDQISKLMEIMNQLCLKVEILEKRIQGQME